MFYVNDIGEKKECHLHFNNQDNSQGLGDLTFAQQTLSEQLPPHSLLKMETLRATGIKPRQKAVLRSLYRAPSRTMSSRAVGVGLSH